MEAQVLALDKLDIVVTDSQRKELIKVTDTNLDIGCRV